MPRIDLPSREDLDAHGKEIWDAVAAPRGGAVGGPFSVWMATPEIAAGANELGNALRLRGGLPGHIFELVTLLCARHWRSYYPWAVHLRLARERGLSERTINAVAVGDPPVGLAQDERCAWSLTECVLRRGRPDDDLFAAALTAFGRDGLIELTSVIGFYTMASIVARTFDIEPSPGS